MIVSGRHRYNKVSHFRQDLETQTCCCCCTAWCWANVLLFLWVLINLALLVAYALMLYVLYSSYGTVAWNCEVHLEDGNADTCDTRKQLEHMGFSKETVFIAVFVQLIVLLVNILAFIGLYNCIPWTFLLVVIIGTIEVIANITYCIWTHQFMAILSQIIPIFLVFFFLKLYDTAKAHVNMARFQRNMPFQDRSSGDEMAPISIAR
eukprot:372904_1